MSSQTTTLIAQCHCHSNTHLLHLPTATLPLKAYICHCTTSRHVSGILFTTYISIPTEPQSLQDLTPYSSSDSLIRYFCSHCGAHMFGYHKPSKSWKVATGVLDRIEGVVSFKGSMWVEDTGDGGGALWLREIEGREVEVWREGAGSSERLSFGDGGLKQNKDISKQNHEHLPGGIENRPATLEAHCHCKGVSFSITPPNTSTTNSGTSEYPDLLVPYHTSTTSTRTPPTNEKWWLRCNDTKYLAGTCACTSCRLTSGFPIQTWTFIPQSSLHPLHEPTQSLSFGDLGTLKTYNSSEGVSRDFCARCGASCFWRSESRKSGVVDVGAGLLDAEEGARAERWVQWTTERISFAEEAADKVLVRAVGEGLRAWGEERSREE